MENGDTAFTNLYHYQKEENQALLSPAPAPPLPSPPPTHPTQTHSMDPLTTLARVGQGHVPVGTLVVLEDAEVDVVLAVRAAHREVDAGTAGVAPLRRAWNEG